MQPLYVDPWFTECFAEDRLIPRFHGEAGWVDLGEPILVRAGEALHAMPEQGKS